MRDTHHAIRLLALAALLSVASALRAEAPPGLPRYDLRIVLDTKERSAQVREIVTWTNRSTAATKQIVFNAHAHYEIPDKDIGFLAKSVEILRLNPKEALNFDGPALHMRQVRQRNPHAERKEHIGFRFADDNSTALIVPLAREIKPGESVTLELDFTIKLPARRGR